MKSPRALATLCGLLLLGATSGGSDVRSALDAQGILPFFKYSGEVLGNLTGGQRQGAIYDGGVAAGVRLDLEKLARWRGATLLASALYPHGSSLTQNYTRDLGVVSNIDAYDSIRLYEFWLEQTFADDTCSIRIGQLLADAEFFVSDYGSVFLNSTFGALPLASQNLPAPVYPLATPGIRLTVAPCDWFALRAGVFDGNVGQARLDQGHGVDWHLDPDEGASAMLEVACLLNQGKNSEGLRGAYKLGCIYHTADFDNNLSGSPQSGNFCAYFVADQQVWRERGGSEQGLGTFLRIGGAPSDRNLVSFYFDTGLSYKGLLPNRHDDILGVGLSYTKLSSDLRDDAGAPLESHHETIVEVTYQAVINPWISVQPDLQYIFNPGATSNAANALVAGLRFTLSF